MKSKLWRSPVWWLVALFMIFGLIGLLHNFSFEGLAVLIAACFVLGAWLYWAYPGLFTPLSDLGYVDEAARFGSLRFEWPPRPDRRDDAERPSPPERPASKR